MAPERYIDLDGAVEDVVAAAVGQRWDVFVRVYTYPSQHIVQFGETLASIARDHGFPYPWLQQVNPNVGSALRPGQVVNIPSPDVLLSLPVVLGKRIVISISQQRMWAYEWEALKWAWTVSTGIESSPTSPGVFQVQSHDINAYAASWDLWMPYFIGIYRRQKKGFALFFRPQALSNTLFYDYILKFCRCISEWHFNCHI